MEQWGPHHFPRFFSVSLQRRARHTLAAGDRRLQTHLLTNSTSVCKRALVADFGWSAAYSDEYLRWGGQEEPVMRIEQEGGEGGEGGSVQHVWGRRGGGESLPAEDGGDKREDEDGGNDNRTYRAQVHKEENNLEVAADLRGVW